MPVFLRARDDMLTVEFSGLRGPEFQEALRAVQSTSGRRWNPDEKRNEFPKDADTALQLMQKLEPIADPEVQTMVRNHSAEVAGQLITKLAPDAELLYNQAEKLRPYQRSAVEWLCDHPRSILADEMGLGKTVMGIATVLEYYQRTAPDHFRDPILVICPNAMRGTWLAEIEKWAEPEYPPVAITGKNPAKRASQLSDGIDAGWVVLNWEKLRIMPELAKTSWAAVIADEAHRAKNRKAQQTKALWKLAAPLQLAMTGTPVMNHPGELWSLLRWLRPEQYAQHIAGGGYWPFYYNYVEDYPAGRYGRVITGVKNPDKLRFELADKLVRRTKVDALPDLPAKLPTQIIEVEFTPAQRKLYEEVESAVLLDMKAYAEVQVRETDPDISEEECALLVSEKLAELAEMPLERLVGLVDNAGARIAKLRQITAAAKVEAAVELIREEPDTPVVAFTWHVEAARNLAEKLEKGKPHMTVGVIAGTDDSEEPKQAFQLGESDHLVVTISKGGAGLTLTRSSNPLLVEEDWVPANNDQAIDRTHRIGQVDPVTPRALRVKGTVDDGKIAPANRMKRLISEQVHG